jgi:hypothetical protein
MSDFNFPIDFCNPERLPTRDENGYVLHPDFYLIYGAVGVDDEGEAAGEYVKEKGYEFKGVSFEDDAPEWLADRYSDEGDPDVSEWKPTMPKGGGWRLYGIWDSEDGPRATFVRKVLDRELHMVEETKGE